MNPKQDQTKRGSPGLNRRQMLGVLTAAGLASWLGCDSGPVSTDGSPSNDGGGGSETQGSDGMTDGGWGDVTPAASWATGGTKSMTAKGSYPNPFTAIPAAERARHLQDVARMADGAMLASKTVAVA